MHVLPATNSAPYVAVSDAAYFLEYHMIGVLLIKWIHLVLLPFQRGRRVSD